MKLDDFDDDLPDNIKEVIRRHKEHFGEEEELHPDLVPHLRTDTVMPMVHHPLMVTVAAPPMYKQLNQGYLRKKEIVQQAMENGDWRQYMFMHERPYRFDALLYAAAHGLKKDPKAYWEAVGNVWTDSENIHQNQSGWVALWTAKVPHREFCMDEEERQTLAALPDQIPVYRGVGHKRFKLGLSWSLDHGRAEWFSKRFSGINGRVPHVFEGIVGKNDVLAHFLGRGEDEIVVLPSNVKNLKQL